MIQTSNKFRCVRYLLCFFGKEWPPEPKWFQTSLRCKKKARVPTFYSNSLCLSFWKTRSSFHRVGSLPTKACVGSEKTWVYGLSEYLKVFKDRDKEKKTILCFDRILNTQNTQFLKLSSIILIIWHWYFWVAAPWCVPESPFSM